MSRRPAIAAVALALLAIAATCATTAIGAAPKKVYVEGDIVNQELVYAATRSACPPTAPSR